MNHRESITTLSSKGNSYSHYNSPTNLPLTQENLSSLNDQSSKALSNTVLERYCRESVRPSVRGKSWMHSPDRVLESPRLLSFPYHNDSHFLPTAEQLQYNIIHHGSVHSSSSQTETASLLSSLPVSSRHRSSLQKNSAFSSTPDRRSLPNRVIPHSLHSRASHHRPSSMRTISASTLHSHASSIHKEKDKKHWLKRILKFLGKNKKPSCEKNQVWFRQYSKNPSFNHPPPIMT